MRVRQALLSAYLALPFDLIPDPIPVLGYADEAIIVALVLRSVTRRAGPEAVTRHWPAPRPASPRYGVCAGCRRPDRPRAAHRDAAAYARYSVCNDPYRQESGWRRHNDNARARTPAS